MTNFEKIKAKISEMDIDEFIEFTGGENCENALCKEIGMNYARCNRNKPNHDWDCGKCIRNYLESEVQEDE